MIFPDKNTRDLAAESLKDECSTTPSDRNVKHIYPKLKINGISTEILKENKKEDLRKEIMNKNLVIRQYVEDGKIFEIVFVATNPDSNFCHAIVKVDPIIKQTILNNGKKIFVGLSSCRVTESYHIIQCYCCQNFGHKKGSDRCPLKQTEDRVCLYCAGNHWSRSCAVKKVPEEIKCCNCLRSKNISIKEGHKGHTSTSFTCPLLQLELKSLRNKIMGDEANTQISKNSVVT